jgi:hypothetical protein
MPEPVKPLPEALAPLAAWLAANFPGQIPVEIGVKWSTGQVLPLPFIAAAGPVEQEAEIWVPTAFQQAILDALDGRALKIPALGAAVGDKSRLYKPNGLREL